MCIRLYMCVVCVSCMCLYVCVVRVIVSRVLVCGNVLCYYLIKKFNVDFDLLSASERKLFPPLDNSFPVFNFDKRKIAMQKIRGRKWSVITVFVIIYLLKYCGALKKEMER